MQIGRLNYSYYNNSPAFGSVYDKLINKIKFCTNPKKISVTFDEAKKIYEKLGYKLTNQPGSHAIVTLPDGFNFPLVIPHGGNKQISPDNIKVLRAAIVGDMKMLRYFVHSSNLH